MWLNGFMQIHKNSVSNIPCHRLQALFDDLWETISMPENFPNTKTPFHITLLLFYRQQRILFHFYGKTVFTVSRLRDSDYLLVLNSLAIPG